MNITSSSRLKSILTGSLVAAVITAAPLMSFAKGDNGHNNSNGNNGNSQPYAKHYAISHATNTPPGNAFGRSQNDPSTTNTGNTSSNSWFSFWNNWFGKHNTDASTTGTGVTATSTAAMPPVISGVSSPTVLDVGATGTWTVSASDPENGSLSYSVNWGDQGILPMIMSALAQPVFTQTATFTHVYNVPGTYTVDFTVKDSAGLTSNTSVTVHVIASEANEGAPVISNLTATSSKPTQGTVSWITSERTKSVLWYSTTTPVNPSNAPSIVRNDSTVRHDIALNGLTGGTTYYVLVQATDDEGMTSTSTASFTTPLPASDAPSIGSFTGPTTIPALTQGVWTVIAADPNNSSLNYSVDWGDAPIAMAALIKQPIFVQKSTFDHTYANAGAYVITVTAENSLGLTATATTSVTVTQASTTPPVASTTPTITNAVAMVGSGSVQFSWNTADAADSQIYYSTTTPVVIGATSTVAVTSATLSTSHEVTVSSLSPSTTYHFIIRSTDAASSTQATSEFALTTAPII